MSRKKSFNKLLKLLNILFILMCDDTFGTQQKGYQWLNLNHAPKECNTHAEGVDTSGSVKKNRYDVPIRNAGLLIGIKTGHVYKEHTALFHSFPKGVLVC